MIQQTTEIASNIRYKNDLRSQIVICCRNAVTLLQSEVSGAVWLLSKRGWQLECKNIPNSRINFVY